MALFEPLLLLPLVGLRARLVVVNKFVLVAGASLLVIAGLVMTARLGEAPKGSSEGSPAQSLVANPDLTQIDYQNGAKVVASYLPDKSTVSRATLRIDLLVDQATIGNYDYGGKIVWADTNIDPLPTVSSKLIKATDRTQSVEMTFVRTVGTHYHLLIKDFVGIKNRVLHFYL